MPDEMDQHQSQPPPHESAEMKPDSRDKDAPRVEDVADPSPRDERVAEMLTHTIDLPVLAREVEQQEAPDAADTLESLDEDEAVELLQQMKDLAAAEALSEMQTPLAVGVLKDLIEDEPQYAGHLLEVMASDDAADILQALESPQRERLLGFMEREPARELVELIRFEEESAGGMMNTEFLRLSEGMSVQEAIEYIRDNPIAEQIQDAMVVDEQDRLVGIIALRQILLARAQDSIADKMQRSVKVVHADMDREQVAREFDRYDYSMLPVVNETDRLLGIVTVDDVIDIIRAEQTEDVQKTVGAGAREAVYSSVLEKFRGRFPWLLVSLIMMVPTALIIFSFEDLIRQAPVLAILMPVIAAVVGNAGHQALAVTQRGLVLDELRSDHVMPLLLREWMVGLFNGLVLGVIILLGVGLLYGNSKNDTWFLGGMTGFATMLAMSIGTFFGSAIPMIMKRLGFDPAQSSAIFLIMITDATAFGTILFLVYSMYEHFTGTGV